MKEESGKKYDPNLLNSFFKIIDKVEKKVSRLDVIEVDLKKGLPSDEGEETPYEANSPGIIEPSVFSNISNAQKEILSLYEISQTLSSTLKLDEILDLIAKKLKAVLPFDLAVIFIKQDASDKMTVMNAEGEYASKVF